MPSGDDISVTGRCGNLSMGGMAKVTLATNMASWLE